MYKEKIFIADDQRVVIEGIRRILEAYGSEGGHKIIGQASSVEEVQQEMDKGLKPTVALVDVKFPRPEDGAKAAKIIKENSPKTIIVAFSKDGQTFTGIQWNKHMSGRDLVQTLTDLKH